MSYTSTVCLHCGCITYGSDSLPVKTSILHLHCPKCGWEFAYQKDKTMHCINTDCTFFKVEFKQPEVELNRIEEIKDD